MRAVAVEVPNFGLREKCELRGHLRGRKVGRGVLAPVANEDNLASVEADAHHSLKRRGCLTAVAMGLLGEIIAELLQAFVETRWLRELPGALVLDDHVAVERVLDATEFSGVAVMLRRARDFGQERIE